MKPTRPISLSVGFLVSSRRATLSNRGSDLKHQVKIKDGIES